MLRLFKEFRDLELLVQEQNSLIVDLTLKINALKEQAKEVESPEAISTFEEAGYIHDPYFN